MQVCIHIIITIDKKMIIYLDESKRIWKWKIVVWWFLSFHNTHYIEKFMKNKKKDFWILERVELKSSNKYWKIFLEKLFFDKDFEKLDIYTFWFNFDNYFFDSSETYTNILMKIFVDIFWKYNYFSKKVIVVHDNINVPNNKDFEKKINTFLKNKFDIKSEFKIRNSKSFLSLQLADIIVWEYKKLYFFEWVNNLDDFIMKKDINKQKI